ncbi:MAG TPA: type IX secretion system membrane protein PorP/SprF [Bacteroidia bacterium]|nr:type IX secretion system membrane protein PorP/SprF [Bacteroidia bacterium]
MKQLYKLPLALLCLFVTASQLKAQDPEFTQFYANPLYLNPALAGNKICTRVNTNYRVQWPNIYGTYTTVGVSIDKLAHSVKGGVGLMVMQDRAAQGTLNTTGVGLIYAPVIPLTRKSSISFAIQAGWWQKAVNWSKLTFGDQIDPRRGFTYETNELPPDNATRGNFDLGAGMVFTSSHVFVGAAVHHILEQNESFLNGTSKLPRKYTVHAGGLIPLGHGRYDGDSYISPNVMYRQQGDFKQLNLGMYFKKDKIVGGLWYRGNDSFIMLLGVEANQFRIGYSYDVTISKLTNATAGSHELSLGYQFTCKPPNKKYRPGICPSW